MTYKTFSKEILTSLFVCCLFLMATPFAFSHGTVTYPPSRIWNCYQENPENPNSSPCIAAVASHGTQPLYDWSEINQGNADGNHMQFVPDGNLASGGRPEKYGGLDLISPDWVATSVTPGPFTVTWINSAPHATAYFEVYITTENWTPADPLTWDKLILLTRTPGSSAADQVDIPVTLPERIGKHVIYSIWQRSDSPEAFYSTSDIDFGGIPTNTDDFEMSVKEFSLGQPFPNPFQQTSRIDYQLAEGARVSLKVYDIHGREISTLVEGTQAAGKYEVAFNGEGLGNGIYLYVLQVGSKVAVKQMILQK